MSEPCGQTGSKQVIPANYLQVAACRPGTVVASADIADASSALSRDVALRAMQAHAPELHALAGL